VGSQLIGQTRMQPGINHDNRSGQQRRADRVARTGPAIWIFDGVELLLRDDRQILGQVAAMSLSEAHGSVNRPTRIGRRPYRAGREDREKQREEQKRNEGGRIEPRRDRSERAYAKSQQMPRCTQDGRHIVCSDFSWPIRVSDQRANSP